MRFWSLILQIAGAVALMFAIISLMPYDPTIIFLFEYRGTPEQRAIELAHLRHELGIDVPVYQQYFNFFKRLFTQGSLGTSWFYKTSITNMYSEAMKYSFLTFGIAFIFYTPIAAILGIYAAKKHQSKFDHTARVLTTITYSIPSYLLGIWIIFLTYQFNLAPWPYPPPKGIELIKYSVLPILTTIIIYTGFQFRFVRTYMLRVLREDYIRTARAKGLNERQVIYKHALRNALPNLFTTIAVTFPIAFSGVAALEIVFDIPGGGNMMVDAALNFDWPVMIAGAFIYTIINAIIMAVTDILIFTVSPKTELGIGTWHIADKHKK